MKKLLFTMAVGATLFMACSKNEGCIDSNATNYDESAEEDDGSCTYANTSTTDTTTNTGAGTTDSTNTGTTTSTGNYVKFDGETYFDIAAASARTQGFEYDTSGRFIYLIFYEKLSDVTANDVQGKVVYAGIWGSKDSIGVFTGDYTNSNQWTDSNDANTAPDYSCQSIDSPADDLEESDKTPEVFTITKSASGEYEIKIKIEVYYDVKGLVTMEVYYKGTLQ